MDDLPVRASSPDKYGFYDITVFRHFPQFDSLCHGKARDKAIRDAGLSTDFVDKSWKLKHGDDDKIANLIFQT